MLVSAYAIDAIDATPLWLWRLEGLSEKPEKVVIDRPRTHIWQPQLSPDGRCWPSFLGQAAIRLALRWPSPEWSAPR